MAYFEVDVVQWDDETRAKQGNTGRLEGCDKMSLCGTVLQTRGGIFRIVDNRERDDAVVTAVMRVDQTSYDMEATQSVNSSLLSPPTVSVSGSWRCMWTMYKFQRRRSAFKVFERQC